MSEIIRTDKSTTISETLQKAAKENGVSVLLGAKVSKITHVVSSSSSSYTENKTQQYEISFQQSSSSIRSTLAYTDETEEDVSIEKSSNRVEKNILCDRVIIATGSSR